MLVEVDDPFDRDCPGWGGWGVIYGFGWGCSADDDPVEEIEAGEFEGLEHRFDGEPFDCCVDISEGFFGVSDAGLEIDGCSHPGVMRDIEFGHTFWEFGKEEEIPLWICFGFLEGTIDPFVWHPSAEQISH